ncbi:E3 UFM1-protein ligase 1 [Clonorchis sinensis]|uniref:E3 UFM1-protein ligase 1 n=1 Tax=Clonorchis sinensis TaxID=79923 RepID=A0A3R7ENR8_CLOSI|nr:E3 UFM1-protein ligase 1 [Clonorchis sinensis]
MEILDLFLLDCRHFQVIFRCLAAMPLEGSTRAGILPGGPSLDRGIREVEVGFEPRTFCALFKSKPKKRTPRLAIEKPLYREIKQTCQNWLLQRLPVDPLSDFKSLEKDVLSATQYGNFSLTKKTFSSNTHSVPSCHATRRKREGWDIARLSKSRQGKSRGRGRVRTTNLSANATFLGEMAQLLEREFTDRKVRGLDPVSASQLPLSKLGQPGSIPALVLPLGGMTARHRKDLNCSSRHISNMATWAEVRELAAKLKTTQDKSSALRLSERTWVDIVKYLTSTNRLKLIFTTDGRSYLTREELQKEIREEVEAHNGRVTLMELASNLDVDPLIVEARLSEMVVADAQSKCADRLISIPGEVISESYVRRVAHEIQDRLEERGEVTIGELATVFGLPTAFLVNILNDYQGLLFRVQKYGEKYITDTFMAKNRAMVRGYFTAIMRPVTLSSAASKLNVPENLLSGIVGSLIANGQLCGSLVAGRGTYVPTCYSLAEDSYVRAFYTQNGYVEWTYLKRLGSTDPASYLRSLLPNAVHLSGVSMGPMAIDHLKAVVEEAARDATWADLSHCLPAGLSVKDRIDLVTKHIRKLPLRTVEDGLFVVSEEFVNGCMKHFDKLIHERAELAARENRQNLAASHSRNAASELNAEHAKRSHHTNKGGFGMGAREIKMKNVKKKYLPSKRRQGGGQLEADVDYNCYDVWTSSTESVFAKWISADELNDVLTNALSSELPGEIVSGIVSCLQPQLERSFSNILDSIFVPNSDTARRRETIAQTQEVINSMLFAIQASRVIYTGLVPYRAGVPPEGITTFELLLGCGSWVRTSNFLGTPFRCLTAMSPGGSTKAGILPGCPSLDRGSREAEVGFEPIRSVNSRSNH